MTGAFGVTGAEVAGVGAVFESEVDAVAGLGRPLADCAVHGGTAGALFRSDGERYAELMAALGGRLDACAAAVASIGERLRSASAGYDGVEDEQAALFNRLDEGSP